MEHDSNELLRYVEQGFRRVKQAQQGRQGTEQNDRLVKSIRDHFDLGQDDDPTEDQAGITRRRLAAGRERSRSEGHDEGQSENDVKEDTGAPQFGGETPIDGP